MRRCCAVALLAALSFATPAAATIMINTPNGGQTYNVGDSVTIEWTVIAPFPTIDWDIFYSTQSASGPWVSIVQDLVPVGSVWAGTVHTHSWTIPPAASGNSVWVRVIQDNTGMDFEDVSDQSFTVVLPIAFEITVPNGGETYSVGDSVDIQWEIVEQFPIDDWDIAYSTQSANGPWSDVVADLPVSAAMTVGSVHSHTWIVPAAAESNNVWIRIVQDGPVNYRDKSDLPFVVTLGGVAQYRRGDVNDDGSNNIADAIYLLGNLFPIGAPNVLPCLDAADGNADGSINIADAVAILGSLFGSPAVPLVAPYPACGVADLMGCVSYTTCP